MASFWDRLKAGNFGVFGSEGLVSPTPGAAVGIGTNTSQGAPAAGGPANALDTGSGGALSNALYYGLVPGAALGKVTGMGGGGGGDPQDPNQQGRASKFFLGTEGRTQQLPHIDPQVQKILEQLGPDVQARLQANLQGGGFGPIENQARKNFGQQRQGIAERLNMLGGGEQRGQAGEHYLDSLSGDFESQLAAHKAQYGLQEGSQLQNLLSQLMQPRNENLYIPRQPGAIETVTPQVIETLTKLGLTKLIPLLFAL